MSKHVTIVLLQDVPNLGARGSVKTVAFGFAKNALLPKGLAALATTQAVERAKRDVATRERSQQQEKQGMEKLRHMLSNIRVTIQVKANEKGSLFGGVNAESLVIALQAQGIQGVSKDLIQIPKKIESIGDTHFVVTLGGARIEIPLRIEAENPKTTHQQ